MSRFDEVTNNNDLIIAQRVKELRKTRGLGSKQLASAIKVSYQQLFKYEAGTNRISCGRIVSIANALSVPVDYFFDNLAAELPAESKKERLLIEMVKEFRLIPSRIQQYALVNMARAINRGVDDA